MSNAKFFQADLVYWDGALREGLTLEVSPDGRVIGVRDDVPQGAIRLRGRALLPGMVNAHSHAFQRLIRGRTEYVASGEGKDDFWSWRENMYKAAEALDPEGVFVASRQAFLEMALAGITTVGEFHYLHHQPDGTPYADRNTLALEVIRAAKEIGIRICLLRVGYARSGFKMEPNPRQRRFIDPSPDVFLSTVDGLGTKFRGDPTVSIGIAPHSVRACSKEWLAAVGARPEVIHMHVAEQPAELEACKAEHGKSPVELLEELGLLRPDFTAVHAVHLADRDLQLLGRGEVTVCACPSTERNLGDGIVRADDLFRAGVALALGSDSQATVDLLDEARQLEGHLRLLRLRRAVLDPGGGRANGLADRLFGMATHGGGRALGMKVGALTPGKYADFFTVDLEHPSLAGARKALLATLLFSGDKSAIKDVFVGGKPIVEEGHHAAERDSGPDFDALCKKVFA